MSVVQLTRRQVRASVLAKCRESRRWLKSEIARRIKENDKARAAGRDPFWSDESMAEAVAHERGDRLREITYYARVRILRVPHGYCLVYPEADGSYPTSGTGPFPRWDEAAGWFTKGGR